MNTVSRRSPGAFVQGRFLSASVGSWNRATPLTFEYQWLRCRLTAASQMAPTAHPSRRPRAPPTRSSPRTSASGYPPHHGIEQPRGPKRLRQRSAVVQSSSTSTAQAPRNTRVPRYRNVCARPGPVASVGAWTGTTPLTYTYEWLRCEADGGRRRETACTTGSAVRLETHIHADADRPRTTASSSDRSRHRPGQRRRRATQHRVGAGQAGATPAARPPPPPPAQLPPGAGRLPPRTGSARFRAQHLAKGSCLVIR